MAVPTRPEVIQRLAYPRLRNDLRGAPFYGFFGWAFGDPGDLVAAAELVVAVDVMTREQILVFGEVALFPIEFSDASATFSVLAVELDLETEEIDSLAILVELVKGDHDLPWEVG